MSRKRHRKLIINEIIRIWKLHDAYSNLKSYDSSSLSTNVGINAVENLENHFIDEMERHERKNYC